MGIQLTVFMENRPGKLETITKILSKGRINIRGITLASEGEFGIVKILADDPDRAYGLLRENHLTVSKRQVVTALIDDKPGGLHDLLELLSSHKINVEDCYGVALEEGRQAAIVLEVDDFPRTEALFKSSEIQLLADTEVF
jgi:hypothetical protein